MSLEQAFIKHLLRAISDFKPRECSSDGEALLPWSLVLEEERQQAAAAPALPASPEARPHARRSGPFVLLQSNEGTTQIILTATL